MISAVDLLKGIAVGAGMHNIEVPGANGGLHTNYEGKAEAAVKAVLEDGFDFVYVHVEAPDEMGHQGSVERKVQAIEYLDQRLIRIVKERMERVRRSIPPADPAGSPDADLLPDPCVDAGSLCALRQPQKRRLRAFYSEKNAAAAGIFISEGYRLMDRFLEI